MPKIEFIKNKHNEIVYPKTTVDAVLMADGHSLAENIYKINNFAHDIDQFVKMSVGPKAPNDEYTSWWLDTNSYVLKHKSPEYGWKPVNGSFSFELDE